MWLVLWGKYYKRFHLGCRRLNFAEESESRAKIMLEKSINSVNIVSIWHLYRFPIWIFNVSFLTLDVQFPKWLLQKYCTGRHFFATATPAPLAPPTNNFQELSYGWLLNWQNLAPRILADYPQKSFIMYRCSHKQVLSAVLLVHRTNCPKLNLNQSCLAYCGLL